MPLSTGRRFASLRLGVKKRPMRVALFCTYFGFAYSFLCYSYRNCLFCTKLRAKFCEICWLTQNITLCYNRNKKKQSKLSLLFLKNRKEMKS